MNQQQIPWMGSRKPLFASDGFGAYPLTDGKGNPAQRYFGGVGKTWGGGYGTWGAAGGVMQASVLVGGTAINLINAGSPNVRITIQIPSYSASWAGGVLRYLNNTNFVYGYWDGSLIRLTKMVGGVSAGLIAQAAAFSNGSILTLECDLTTFRIKLDGVQIGADQTINDLQLLGSPLHGVLTANVNNQFDNYNCYPLGVTKFHKILPFGDSKSGTTGDATYVDGFPSQVNTALLQFPVIPARLATGGATVASRATSVVADLNSSLGVPEYVLCNLGANDVAALPAEATWKANYQIIFNAIHTIWPGALIYVMRPWRRTYGAECDTLATWIADLVAANPGRVFSGPDERIFLENGDDGVTYTADGIHPNTAGYALTGAQWRTILWY